MMTRILITNGIFMVNKFKEARNCHLSVYLVALYKRQTFVARYRYSEVVPSYEAIFWQTVCSLALIQ